MGLAERKYLCLLHPGWDGELHRLTGLPTEQRAPHGRLVGDAPLRGRGFGAADDGVGVRALCLERLDLHDRTHLDHVRFGAPASVVWDDYRILDHVFKLLDAGLHEGLLALGLFVLGIIELSDFLRTLDAVRDLFLEHQGQTVEIRNPAKPAQKQRRRDIVGQVGDDAPGPERGRVGLNHMAWYMESLEDLEELYLRMKEKNVPIDRVANHGVSIGIYLRDPDGNGIEVSYELPRSEWPREDKLFTDIDSRPGRFPGAWDEDLEKAAAR